MTESNAKKLKMVCDEYLKAQDQTETEEINFAGLRDHAERWSHNPDAIYPASTALQLLDYIDQLKEQLKKTKISNREEQIIKSARSLKDARMHRLHAENNCEERELADRDVGEQEHFHERVMFQDYEERTGIPKGWDLEEDELRDLRGTLIWERFPTFSEVQAYFAACEDFESGEEMSYGYGDKTPEAQAYFAGWADMENDANDRDIF